MAEKTPNLINQVSVDAKNTKDAIQSLTAGGWDEESQWPSWVPGNALALMKKDGYYAVLHHNSGGVIMASLYDTYDDRNGTRPPSVNGTPK